MRGGLEVKKRWSRGEVEVNETWVINIEEVSQRQIRGESDGMPDVLVAVFSAQNRLLSNCAISFERRWQNPKLQFHEQRLLLQRRTKPLNGCANRWRKQRRPFNSPLAFQYLHHQDSWEGNRRRGSQLCQRRQEFSQLNRRRQMRILRSVRSPNRQGKSSRRH